jgi:hypothetical protein
MKRCRDLIPVSLLGVFLVIIQCHMTIGYNISSYGAPEFGLGFIWTQEPVIAVQVSAASEPTISIAVPANVTAYGLWSIIPIATLIAPVAGSQ